MKTYTNPTVTYFALATLALLASLLNAGCNKKGDEQSPPSGSTNAEGHQEKTDKGDPNRIGIPKAVRSNLGITFATVERRPVRRTVRVPGQFELRNEAHRTYRTILTGRVTLKVKQYDRVKQSQILAEVESPKWRELQHLAVEAKGNIQVSQATLAIAKASLTETNNAIIFKAKRIESLKGVQIRRVDLDAELESLRNKLPRLKEEIESANVKLQESNAHYVSRIAALSSISGVSVEELTKPVIATDNTSSPYWQTIDRLVIRANADGIVDQLGVTDGGWLTEGSVAIKTVDPTMLRFHAHAPQTDIGKFKSGQVAQVVPPMGGTVALSDVVKGSIAVGFRGHPDERVIPLYLTPQELPAWAKPGVSAYLEVFIDGESKAQLAIPMASVVRDELQDVFFRRNPNDENQAVRIEADLGSNDGRWIVVKSGVKAGDQVVLEGAYTLKLASSSRPSAPEGYHYHADGSLHKDH